MDKKKTSKLEGISVIHFSDESKNIHADVPLYKDQAKKLSKRIYKDAMTALSTEQSKRNYLIAKLFPNNSYSDNGNST
jgi:hypothetical protein